MMCSQQTVILRMIVYVCIYASTCICNILCQALSVQLGGMTALQKDHGFVEEEGRGRGGDLYHSSFTFVSSHKVDKETAGLSVVAE